LKAAVVKNQSYSACYIASICITTSVTNPNKTVNAHVLISSMTLQVAISFPNILLELRY